MDVALDLRFDGVVPSIIVVGFVGVGSEVVVVDGVDDRFIDRREVERALSRSMRTRVLSASGRHWRRMIMMMMMSTWILSQN